MACDLESLNHLEALLTEFYSADNAKKREIDKILTDFCGQPASWKSCLFYMFNTRNDHVLMFCLKVFEIAVSRQSATFGSGEKEMIRVNCYQMLMSGKDLSFFIRNKLMKLIVTIARFDWPQNYSSFLDEVNHLLSLEDHVLLGLNFLVLASEEFGSSKDDISSGRKRQLTEGFKSNIPLLLHKVAGILREVRIKIDATQPSSLSLTNGVPSRTSSCVEEKWLNILKSGLECITGLLNWFEPRRTEEENAFLQSLFSVIVELATNFLVSQQGLHCCPSQCRFQIAELALSCICEVLSMKLCSKLFNTDVFPYFVADSHKNVRHILGMLVNESQNIWSYLNEGRYLSKMVDFLHLFIKNHLKSVEGDQEFFQILIKFTFEQQPYTSLYVSCLSMWTDLFEHLTCQKSGRFPENSSSFRDIILEVAAKVLTSIQFKHNQSHLESLDDDVLDDDFRTEWQNYLLENTEVILKVAKLYHNEVLLYLNQPFEEALRTYFGLGGYIMTVQNSGEGPSNSSVRQSRRFVITAENDCKKLHCMLRDLSTFLHILGTLADNFVGSNSREDLRTGCILFQRLLGLMDYSSRMRFHEVDSAIKNVLESDFIEVHAESLAAVKAWCPFLSRIRTDPSEWASLGIDCNEMIPSILHSLLPLLQIEFLPEKILLSASQLLLSFVVEIKPPLIDSSFHCLFANGITMATAPPKALTLTYRALFLHLLSSMPPQKVDDSMNQHKELLRVFCNFLFKDFSNIYDEVSQSAARSESVVENESVNAVVQRTMEVMTDVVLGIDGASTKKVEVCYECILEHVERAIDMLNIFVNRKETSCKMMGFFLAIIQTFRSQMGAELLRSVLDRFLVIFSRKLVIDSLKDEESSGHELIVKLLLIFETLVKDGSPQSRSFLPSILDICLNRIHATVAERPSPCVKPALFAVFFSTLKSNWNLFFPSLLLNNNNIKLLNIKNHMSPQLQAQYQEYFALMMRAYDTSLSQSDVELARQILDQLEALNKQFKMYSKPSFRDQFLPRFLFLLTSLLIHKVHDLLREEVVAAIFSMAAVDFGFFYKNFIPQLLASCPLGEECSRFLGQGLTTTDESVSFSQKMQSFVADLRFFLNETAFNATVMGPTL